MRAQHGSVWLTDDPRSGCPSRNRSPERENDDDDDEETRGERQRNIRVPVCHTVHDGDDEVHQHEGGQPAPGGIVVVRIPNIRSTDYEATSTSAPTRKQ